MVESCKIYTINPKHWHIFHDLYLKEKGEIGYKAIPSGSETPMNLKIYFEPREVDGGYECLCGVDIPTSLYSRDTGTTYVKETIDTYFRIYPLKGLNLFVIFGPRGASSYVVGALAMGAQQKKSELYEFIIPISIRLDEKEKELQNEFFDLRRFWAKDTRDISVKTATIGGIMLQHTPDYNRYIRQMDGKLKSIVFKWKGVTILLSSDGKLFTHTSFDSNERKWDFFKEVINILFKLDAVHIYQP